DLVESADVDEDVSESPGERRAHGGRGTPDHLPPAATVTVLAAQDRDRAQAASAEDVELAFDGTVVCGLPQKDVVRPPHPAHQTLGVAFVRDVEWGKRLDVRASRGSPSAGHREELVGRHARHEERAELVVTQGLTRVRPFE